MRMHSLARAFAASINKVWIILTAQKLSEKLPASGVNMEKSNTTNCHARHGL